MTARVPALPAHEVHVWALPVDAFEREHGLLSPEEQTRAARFRFDADRALYIAGRAGARRLISAYAGLDAAALRFASGEHGKPALDGSVLPLHFNWSHSGELALFAISPAAQVGVDIERTARFADIDAIAERVFSERELLDYRAQEGEARRIAFFNGWTRKEAFIKATGEGMARALKGFDVALLPSDLVCLRAIEGNTDAAACWSLHAFEPRAGYAAAVAVAAAGVALRVLEW
jgi:4'-phosphopantetheinyl transferase